MFADAAALSLATTVPCGPNLCVMHGPSSNLVIHLLELVFPPLGGGLLKRSSNQPCRGLNQDVGLYRTIALPELSQQFDLAGHGRVPYELEARQAQTLM